MAETIEAPERLFIHAGANVETKPCGCGADVEYVRADLATPAARKSRARREKPEEVLRRSDLTGQLAERDNIEHGHHESLPRGEHVTRLKRG